jgi:threonine aldolase
MSTRKRRSGGQPKNSNARVYTEPMTRCMVVRMTEDQYEAFVEQCEAFHLPAGTQARELCLKFAGWSE